MSDSVKGEIAGDLAGLLASHLSFSACLPILVNEDAHALTPNLTLNPVAGEKSGPALTLAGENNLVRKVEATIEEKQQMAFNPNQVPLDITDAERTRALAKVKETDSKAAKGAEEDIINTGVKKSGYVLWHVRKRGGKKDAQTGRKPVTATDLIWMPHPVDSSMDEFVSYFSRKYGQGDKTAGEVVFKERSLQSEVIVLRSKMAPKVKAPGAKRNKFRS